MTNTKINKNHTIKVGNVLRPLAEFISDKFDFNLDLGYGLSLNKPMWEFLRSRTSFIVSALDNSDNCGDFYLEDSPGNNAYAQSMFKLIYENSNIQLNDTNNKFWYYVCNDLSLTQKEKPKDLHEYETQQHNNHTAWIHKKEDELHYISSDLPIDTTKPELYC